MQIVLVTSVLVFAVVDEAVFGLLVLGVVPEKNEQRKC